MQRRLREFEEDLLVIRCQQGDREAYEGLVRRYEGEMASLVFHITGNHDDVRDLVQETFIKAFRGLGGFRRGSRFSTWLHRIATNLAIDHVRRAARRPQRVDLVSREEGESEPEIADPVTPSPRVRFERTELEQAIRLAVHSLPPRQQAAVVLHMMEGFPCERVAEIMKCRTGTVKAMLFKARQTLRGKLAGFSPA